MDFSGIRILVIGAGISGIAAADLLSKESAHVILFDENDKLKKEDLLQKLNHFHGSIHIGSIPEEAVSRLDMAVISPGISCENALAVTLQKRGIPLIGEVELAYAAASGRIAAVTGTNGKTTTTALIAKIMRAFYDHVLVAGNIGIPYTKVAKQTDASTITVIETSSFQLETIESFRPDVSLILNITPDHLDRHHTMENYIKAKANIFKNQTASDICILNYEDSIIQSIAGKVRASIIWFSSCRVLERGIYLENGDIIYSTGRKKQILCRTEELHILGNHNYENAMAAAAAGIAFGIPAEIIGMAMKEFQAVEHRIEYVAEKNGVKYYNDSKGTNPDAAIQAVKAMKGKTLLIGGGYDKGSDFDDWIQAFEDKVKYLVLLGQTKEKIAAAARKYGFTNIVMTESLEEAVCFCAEHAEPGDNVLLSPACASWGMFQNYEERGRRFKEYVTQICN